MSKKFFILCASLALLFSVCAGAADLLITVAHGGTEEQAAHLGWLQFKKIVEEESNGSIAVEIYPNQQMGGDREVTEGTQLGNISMSHASCSNIAAFAKEFFVLDAPFIFSSRKDVYGKLDGEPGKQLLKSLEKIELKGLGFIENGFRNVTSNKKIVSPSDLAGVKIRVMENKVQMLTWSSLGGNPTPIAFGELFTALQQGTVDAQENPLELIYTNRLYEVQKFVTMTNHIYSPMAVMMNLDFYNSMTDEQRTLVQSAVDRMVAWQRGEAERMESVARATIEKKCEIIELDASQIKAFRDKLDPVYAEIRAQVNNDALANLFM